MGNRENRKKKNIQSDLNDKVYLFYKNLRNAFNLEPNKKDIVFAKIVDSMDRDNMVYLGTNIVTPLANELKCSKTYIREIFKEFEKKNFITKVNIGRGFYIVNPYLVGRGNLKSIQRLRWEFDSNIVNDNVEVSLKITKSKFN